MRGRCFTISFRQEQFQPHKNEKLRNAKTTLALFRRNFRLKRFLFWGEGVQMGVSGLEGLIKRHATFPLHSPT